MDHSDPVPPIDVAALLSRPLAAERDYSAQLQALGELADVIGAMIDARIAQGLRLQSPAPWAVALGVTVHEVIDERIAEHDERIRKMLEGDSDRIGELVAQAYREHIADYEQRMQTPDDIPNLGWVARIFRAVGKEIARTMDEHKRLYHGATS